jgi:hypothetical protein
MNNLKTIPALIFLLFTVTLSAQNPFVRETFNLLEKNDTIRINTAVSDDNEGLKKLSLDPVNFPVVTLPRSILQKVVDVSNQKSRLTEGMLEENSTLRARDTLHVREIATLRSIMDVQQKNIETCEQTNLLLNRSIQSLNGQLEATRDLAKDSNKQSGGKLWAILVGGGIGFGLGVLLGVAVN